LSGLLWVPRAAMLLSMVSTMCAVMSASAIIAQGGREAIRQRVFAADTISTKVVPSISLLVAPNCGISNTGPGVRTLADARRPAPTRPRASTHLFGAKVEHPASRYHQNNKRIPSGALCTRPMTELASHAGCQHRCEVNGLLREFLGEMG
jgi:hypothetical protein